MQDEELLHRNGVERLPVAGATGHVVSVVRSIGVDDLAGDDSVEGGGHRRTIATDFTDLPPDKRCVCVERNGLFVSRNHRDVDDIVSREQSGVLQDGDLRTDHLERVAVVADTDYGSLELEGK